MCEFSGVKFEGSFERLGVADVPYRAFDSNRRRPRYYREKVGQKPLPLEQMGDIHDIADSGVLGVFRRHGPTVCYTLG